MIRMSISDFYKNKLGANLTNIRWSWGASNPLTNQIFLRVWKDQIKVLNGVRCIAILQKTWAGTSPGYKERLEHIEKLSDGADGYS
jgi:putative restriction endonuclease